MKTELFDHAVGSLIAGNYWTSTESGATSALQIFMTDGVAYGGFKTDSYHIRPCRAFTSASPSYSLRDTGPAGGLIFWKSGNNYLEAAPSDIADATWSNITALAIGTTSASIGEGQNNTNEIIAQVGHTASAAKNCNDLSAGGWTNDTTGAMCYYDNDEATYKSDYGALYNCMR
jgi:hypothetical protein